MQQREASPRTLVRGHSSPTVGPSLAAHRIPDCKVSRQTSPPLCSSSLVEDANVTMRDSWGQEKGASAAGPRTGWRRTQFSNGTIKYALPSGLTMVHFVNGDMKKQLPNGTVEYYYHEVDTWHTTMPRGVEVTSFPMPASLLVGASICVPTIIETHLHMSATRTGVLLPTWPDRGAPCGR